MAGPRNPQPALAIEGENATAIEPDREIFGEFDDPPDDDDEIDDYPPGIQRRRKSESAEIVRRDRGRWVHRRAHDHRLRYNHTGRPEILRAPFDLGATPIPARWVRPAQRDLVALVARCCRGGGGHAGTRGGYRSSVATAVTNYVVA